jgi:hypothetical protein
MKSVIKKEEEDNEDDETRNSSTGCPDAGSGGCRG